MGINGTGGFAGALWVGAATSLVVADSSFAHNRAGAKGTGGVFGSAGLGGAVYLQSHVGDAIVASNTLDDNAAAQGGALWLAADFGAAGRIDVVNNVLTNNSASAEGGGLYLESNGGGTFALANDTFVANQAGTSGGGLHYAAGSNSGAGSAELRNSILWGNTAAAGAAFATPTGTVNPVLLLVGDNDLAGGCPAPGSGQWTCGAKLDVDPAFTNPGAGDYGLSNASPAVDQGDGAALPDDAADLDADADLLEPTPHDRAGLPRVVGASVDLGAYEVQ